MWLSATSMLSTASGRLCGNISRRRKPGRRRSALRKSGNRFFAEKRAKIKEWGGVGDSPEGLASGPGGAHPREFRMLAQFGGGLLDRLPAERDQFVGAMKLEHADVSDPDLHQHVGRVAREPRAHNAVLENVEGVDHRGHHSWRPALPGGPGRPVSAAPPPGDHAARVGRRLIGGVRALRAAERVLDGGAATNAVARNVERDDPLGAERARDADWNRIDDRAVEEPASIELHRLEYARQGIGGADRVDQQAAPEPDLMAAADLGGDAGEPDRQILDAEPAKLGGEPRAEPLAADEAAAGEREIQEAEHAAPGQRAGEGLEHVEPAGRVAAADQGADRRADHDIEPQAQRVEFPQRADVGPAARGARSEHDPDFRRPAGPCAARRRLSIVSAIGRPEHRPTRLDGDSRLAACLPVRNLSLPARYSQTINVKLFPAAQLAAAARAIAAEHHGSRFDEREPGRAAVRFNPSIEA